MTDLARLRIAVDTKDLKKADQALKKLETTGNTTSNALGKLPAVFGAIATSMAIKQAIQYADTMKLIEGRLSLVTSSTEELTRVQKELFAISQRSRVGFADTADLYARMARSTEALGYSSEELLKVTETISKSFVISGASAESANAAIIQLGQGFASGTLRGDELNSVMEQSPRLAQAIAEGMGVTIGQLRKLGAEGKITAESVMNALSSQGAAINKEFRAMPTTVGQATVQMENSLLMLIGKMDESTGTTASLASGMSKMAKIMSESAEDITHGWMFTNATLSRTIDIFNLLIEVGKLGGATGIIAATVTGKIGEKLDGVIEAGKKFNVTVEERVAMMYKELEASKKLADEQRKRNEEGGGGAIVGSTTPLMPTATLDYSAHVIAYEDYLLKLEEKKDRLLATLYPIVGVEEKFAEQQELLASLREQELTSFEENEALKTEIKRRYDNEQQKLEENKSKALRGMQQSVALEAVALLGTLASKNKAAAIAGIAIQKGIAIATTIANTQAASMLAFSSQLIPGDPTSLARAAAAAASVESLGAVKVGLIAATGLLQAGQALGGGGGSIGGGGGGNTGGFGSNQPINDNLITGTIGQEAEAVKEVTINLGDSPFVSTEMVRELVNAINDEIGDGVRIKI